MVFVFSPYISSYFQLVTLVLHAEDLDFVLSVTPGKIISGLSLELLSRDNFMRLKPVILSHGKIRKTPVFKLQYYFIGEVLCDLQKILCDLLISLLT